MSLKYFEHCPVTVKKFVTDSNNPFFLFFKTGDIGQPLFVLTEEQMRTFIAGLKSQIPIEDPINLSKTSETLSILKEACRYLNQAGQRIFGIKLIRQLTGAGLREAKEFSDSAGGF